MKYLTEDEIVKEILGRMDDISRATWKSVKRKDLIQGHHSNGRMIRNEFGLWDKENPHVVFDPADHDNHPDQMSMRIMEKVWDALNSEAVDGAQVKADPG